MLSVGMTKPVAIVSLALVFFACEPEADVSPRAAEPEAHAAPASAPVAAEPAAQGEGPPPLPLDQPAITLEVPAPPGFALTIPENGEYRIDVTVDGDANPAMHLYREGELVEADDDGGEGSSARIVRFLEAGSYSIRITEHDARPFTASVQAQRLPPLEPDATITIGPAVDVVFPVLPELRRPETDRDASRAVTLSVPREGEFACVARMDNGRIARMQIIQNGAVLGFDEQRFTELAASITRRFAPGDYEIRVWDAEYRGDMRATVMCDPAGD